MCYHNFLWNLLFDITRFTGQNDAFSHFMFCCYFKTQAPKNVSPPDFHHCFFQCTTKNAGMKLWFEMVEMCVIFTSKTFYSLNGHMTLTHMFECFQNNLNFHLHGFNPTTHYNH